MKKISHCIKLCIPIISVCIFLLAFSAISVGAAGNGELIAYYDFNGSIYNKADTNVGVSFIKSGSSSSEAFYSNGVGEDKTYMQWWNVTSAPGAGYQMIISKNVSSTYSIALRLSYDNVSGYKKIIDYSNFNNDNGFYFYGGHLCYYVSGSNNGPSVFSAGEIVDIIVTRDGSTGIFTFYTVKNGKMVTEMSYSDTAETVKRI